MNITGKSMSVHLTMIAAVVLVQFVTPAESTAPQVIPVPATPAAPATPRPPVVVPATGAPPPVAASPAQLAPDYDAVISKGFDRLRKDDAQGAAASARNAREINARRFEGYALGALAAYAQQDATNAKQLADRAAALAPTDKKAIVSELVAVVNGKPSRSPNEERGLAALRLILEDIDRNTDGGKAYDYYKELLFKSEAFLKEYRQHPEIWTVRAQAAMALYDEVDDMAAQFRDDSKLRENAASLQKGLAYDGRVAALHMMAYGLDSSRDTRVQKVFAQLERRDWVRLKNQPEAEGMLGWTLLNGEASDLLAQDKTSGLAFLRKSAMHGSVAWQTMLGKASLRDNNQDEGLKWLKAAAVQGDLMASAWFGMALIQYAHVEHEGVEWLQKAADRGDEDGLRFGASFLGTLEDAGLRDTTKALAYGRRGIEVAPTSAPMFAALAMAYCANHQDDEANATLAKAVSMSPRDEQIFRANLSFCLAKRK